METQPQNHPPNTNELNNQDPSSNLAGGGILGNSKNNTATSNYLCRQTSTRWTPTTDQIRILKDLYYNNGIRSPTADQIQRISARLRQYGKIEGKNVFYWFQNHKARERQKKRFTGNDIQTPSSFNMNMMNINCSPIQRSSAVPPPHPNHLRTYDNNHKQIYPNINPAPGLPCSTSACSSPAGVLRAGQIGGCANYGSTAMEKRFRDCSISQDETLEEDQETAELQTLALFPMHGDHFNNNGFVKPTPDSSGYYSGSTCFRPGDYANGASLELSLYSYTGWSMDDLHH